MENLDKVKAWHLSIREELNSLGNTKGYIANCNIHWLIKEVERLSANEKN